MSCIRSFRRHSALKSICTGLLKTCRVGALPDCPAGYGGNIMYHCHIQFYLIGNHNNIFNLIKEITPFKNFTHTIWESSEFEMEKAAQADVLFVSLQGCNAGKMLQTLTRYKKKEAEIILLVDKEQAVFLQGKLSEIEDIWTLPLSDVELGFRLEKWQKNYKLKKDFWQSEQFMDICMNSSPNLIWFKDKDGAHEIVNESFCKVVNKTKEQVQGRRHAYIWDVEQDDPACIESELEVMRKKETCVAREFIHTGDGERTLTTYKSPLYDLDGSVMGTVGVAVDVTKEQIYEQEIIEKTERWKCFLLQWIVV